MLTHVPILVVPYAQERVGGTIADETGSHTDIIFPTSCALADVPVQHDVTFDGEDLSAALRGASIAVSYYNCPGATFFGRGPRKSGHLIKDQ
jgi:arylsulfatase A-like enzyme